MQAPAPDEPANSSRSEILWKTLNWEGVELPEVVVVMEGVPEVRIAIFEDELEAGEYTPLSVLRRYVMEGEIDKCSYTPKEHLEIAKAGRWRFAGKRGLVSLQRETDPYTRHCWGNPHWATYYDHLHPLPKVNFDTIYPKKGKMTKPLVILMTIDSGYPQYVPLDRLTTTAWNGGNPLHHAARERKEDFKVFLETFLKTASKTERLAMLHSVDCAGRTPLALAVESRNETFIKQIFEMFFDDLNPREIHATALASVAGGLEPTTRFLFFDSDNILKRTPINVLPTRTIGNSGKPSIVTTLTNKTNWDETNCLDVFFATGRVSIQLLTAVFSNPDSTKELSRKASWRNIGHLLVSEQRGDILCYLAKEKPDVMNELRQHAPAMAHICLTRKKVNKRILQTILEAGCVRSPTVLPGSREGSSKKSVLAAAMESGDEEALDLVLEHYSESEMADACLLHYGDRREVLGIPPLALAASLRDYKIFRKILDKMNEPGTSFGNTTVRISESPWLTEPVVFDTFAPRPLPRDVWSIVAKWLPARELAVVEMTCKGLHDVIASGGYWLIALRCLKKLASERSPHYTRIKLKGKEPLPDPESVTCPKHVISHAVSKGVFLGNCRCVASASTAELTRPGPLPGFSTRILHGWSGYAILGRTVDKKPEANFVLDLHALEGPGHTEILLLPTKSHSAALPKDLRTRRCGLGYDSASRNLFIHPIVLALSIGGDTVLNRCFELLEKSKESSYWGHYCIANADDSGKESDDSLDTTATPSLHVSLLGVAIRLNDEKLIEVAWKLSKKSYLSQPYQYRDLKDNSALCEAVWTGHLRAVELLISYGERVTCDILKTGVKRGSIPIIMELLQAGPSLKPDPHTADKILSLAVLRKDPAACVLLQSPEVFPVTEYANALELASWLGKREFLTLFKDASYLQRNPKYLEAAKAGQRIDLYHLFNHTPTKKNTPGGYSVTALPCCDCVKPVTSDVDYNTLPALYTTEDDWTERHFEILIRSLIGVERCAENTLPDSDSALHEITPLPVYLTDGKTTSADLFHVLGGRGHGAVSRYGRTLAANWHRIYVKNLRRYVSDPMTNPIILLRDMMLNGVTVPIVCKVYHPYPYGPVRFAQVFLSPSKSALVEADVSLLSSEALAFLTSWDPSGRDDREISMWVFMCPNGSGAGYEVRYTGVPSRGLPLRETEKLVIRPVTEESFKKAKEVYYQSEWDAPDGTVNPLIYPVQILDPDSGVFPSSKATPASPDKAVLLTLPSFSVETRGNITSDTLQG